VDFLVDGGRRRHQQKKTAVYILAIIQQQAGKHFAPLKLRAVMGKYEEGLRTGEE
jgi:hypothetical protein